MILANKLMEVTNRVATSHSFFPYFTAPDPKLIKSGGGRDPLGLQPVWSAFGRGLVPNLASPVTQINGINAVLLIHWLFEKPLAKFFSDEERSFRDFFRLMEGLLEYYCWNSSTSHNANCYGTRALSADGDAFKVIADDHRTAVNGLYQYYRGTCRRADLLSNEWMVSSAVDETFSKCWNSQAINALESVLTDPLSKRKAALLPADVFSKHHALKKAVASTFSSTELRKILRVQLLGEACHVAFAKKCAELTGQKESVGKEGWIYWYFQQLENWMEQEGCPAKILNDNLQHAQKCEPFLLVLQDCFDFMLASPSMKLSEVAKDLNKFKQEIQGRAIAFLQLSPFLDTERMRQMNLLAEKALCGTEDFLTALVEHHRKCMEERYRDPQVVLDEGKLIVPGPSEQSKMAILDRLKTGNPWSNGYYLWNAGEIYRQLFPGGDK